MTQDEILAILRAWFLIELMSPQTVRFDDRKKEEPSHVDIELGTEIRWAALLRRQESLFVQRETEQVDESDPSTRSKRKDDGPQPRYIAYLGLSKVRSFEKGIAKAAGLTFTELDEHNATEAICAWASIQLDASGVYIPKSLVISTLPWALMKIRKQRLWGFVKDPNPKEFAEFCTPLESALPFEPDEPVTPELLDSAASMICAACELTGVVAFKQFARINIYDYPSREHQDLLNSFYYEDIAKVMAQVKANKLPPLVAQLFSRLPKGDQIELLRAPANLRALFSRYHQNAAAWPNKKLDPVLMQEAVVEAAHLLTPSSRIVAVNGPPGTGKTTLLRSFIADQVIARARAIAAGNLTFEKTPTDAYPYYELPSAITGFEIVVASANNGAIENISNELPELSSIAGYEDLLFEHRGYYQKVAQFVCDSESIEQGSKKWGLVAASLGNSDKRRRFIEPFWFRDPIKYNHPDLDNFKTFNVPDCEYTLAKAIDDFNEALRAVHLEQADLNDDDFWEDISTKHSTSPIFSSGLQDAKRRAFIHALRVHRAFVRTHWEKIKANLRIWVDIAKKRREGSIAEATAVWRTFFLVTPVVSTTFASASRMLSNVRGLGWAVIDEAGQAAPQAALGLFSRTERAIVVGDPLQLEPVVTLSGAIIRGIREELNIDRSWTAANDTGTSLQTVVEQTTPWGTYRRNEEGEERWFGIPLIIHRRCINPMFRIVNDTVYNSDMQNRTSMEEVPSMYPYGGSCWINEHSTRTGEHTVMPQVDLALDAVFNMRYWYMQMFVALHQRYAHDPELLEKLRKQWKLPDIKIVTPFRETEHVLHERYSAKFHSEGHRGRIDKKDRPEALKWAENNAGTVHKAQGKEAGMIFCILGLDEKNAGATRFATAKPNFMNVAVSRAKYRLYVIGSAEIWGQTNFFRDVQSAFYPDDIIAPSEFRARFDDAVERRELELLPLSKRSDQAAS
ncbi:MAG: DEAD/DEAH box helicase [Bacillati bacterium]